MKVNTVEEGGIHKSADAVHEYLSRVIAVLPTPFGSGMNAARFVQVRMSMGLEGRGSRVEGRGVKRRVRVRASGV
eukprot:1321139-Rhodomonas_salina.1